MRNLLISLLIFGSYNTVVAQTTDSSYFLKLNQEIDNLVIKKDLKALDSLYADDLVFTHGTGKIEGKKGWLGTVEQSRYPKREHDSVVVEVHPGIVLVRGKMSIQRIDQNGTATYILKYVRVYALRSKRWQMISHFTFWEKSLEL